MAGGGTPVDQNLYQQIIGCLIYQVTGTQPDRMFATMLLSQYASQPNLEHLGAAKRVWQYLKGTRELALIYISYSMKPRIEGTRFTE